MSNTQPRSPPPSQLPADSTAYVTSAPSPSLHSSCASPSPSAHSCSSDHDAHAHAHAHGHAQTHVPHQQHGGAARSASCSHNHHHEERENDDLKDQVQRIMRTDATSAEKAMQIHQLFAAQRAATLKTTGTERGEFPGAGAPLGCEHYKQKCWILAPCCDRYYPCRRCHDEAENHEIDRHAIAFVACVVCGEKDQPVSDTCRNCGVRFAEYFCEPCRLYNDDDSPERTAYHCDKCGICRVGIGLGIDKYHCDLCNTCWPIERKHDHPCRERNLDANCPICNVHLATSTENTCVLPCSHAIHVECLEKYVKAGNYTCPLCAKSSMFDKETMAKWYQTLDERLKHDVMPPEFEHRVSKVLCNDCETKTVTKFHFRFHKCKDCGGYNTKVLEQWDKKPPSTPDSSEEERRSNGETTDEGGGNEAPQ